VTLYFAWVAPELSSWGKGRAGEGTSGGRAKVCGWYWNFNRSTKHHITARYKENKNSNDNYYGNVI
jgi:hypothetical protein